MAARTEEGNDMHEQALKEIMGNLDNVYRVLSIVGGLIVAMFSTIGIILKILSKTISENRNERERQITDTYDKVSEDMSRISNEIGKIDEDLRQHDKCIVAIKHDMAAMVQICKERHGK